MTQDFLNTLTQLANSYYSSNNPLIGKAVTEKSDGLRPKATVGGRTGNNYSQQIGGISTGVNLANNLASGFITPKEGTSSSQQKTIGNLALQSSNPWVKLGGATWNTLSTIGDLTGTNSSTMSETEQETAGLSDFQRVMNNTLSYMPLAGAFMSKTGEVAKNDDVDKLSGAYSNSVNYINTMADMGDQRFLGGKKINSGINTANEQAKMISNIYNTNTLRKNSNTSQELQHQINQRYGLYAKDGAKLLSKEELHKIQACKKEITKFQNGGSILIPEGALHKNKHNMDETNPELAKELTNKGIPVVVTDEKGNVEQCAEIERNEMILEKSLTNKVEDLWKKGDEDSMTECGKIIVCTLFNNCDDNTGLVKEVE